MKYAILSIEAWAGMEENTWEWNNWYKVGEIEKIPENDSEIIQHFISEGFFRPEAKGGVEIEDDGYNVILKDKKTGEPLYAIEYGNKV